MGNRIVTVSKAVPIYAGDEVPSRTIAIIEPGCPFTGENVVAEATAFFKQQAEMIHEALTESLPGGTLSHLFALMAVDRASIFRVLDPAADRANAAAEFRGLLREGAPARTDFEVQYRELHVEWRSLLDQVTAALAIHHPCHTAGPADGGRAADCERSHQYRSEQAECIGCSYTSSDQPTGWPCATAQALGASG